MTNLYLLNLNTELASNIHNLLLKHKLTDISAFDSELISLFLKDIYNDTENKELRNQNEELVGVIEDVIFQLQRTI